MVVEDVIFFELRRVKIHVAARLIGIAGIEQLRDDLDIRINTAGCRLDDVGPLDVELSAVVKERVGVEPSSASEVRCPTSVMFMTRLTG